LAVFYKSAWKLSPVEKPDHKWIVAIDVVGPENFTLIAVWAWIEKGGIPGYVKLIRQSLVKHPEWFDRGPVVIAGDFNSNSRWDKLPEENHSSLVGHLAQRGLVSAYHSRHDEEQGRETKSTFYQGRKFDQPYHIDYIFTPIEWNARVNNFEIGDFGQWSGLSDHCPLTIDVASN
jgi:exodeoxyribonuclease-3